MNRCRGLPSPSFSLDQCHMSGCHVRDIHSEGRIKVPSKPLQASTEYSNMSLHPPFLLLYTGGSLQLSVSNGDHSGPISPECGPPNECVSHRSSCYTSVIRSEMYHLYERSC